MRMFAVGILLGLLVVPALPFLILNKIMLPSTL